LAVLASNGAEPTVRATLELLREDIDTQLIAFVQERMEPADGLAKDLEKLAVVLDDAEVLTQAWGAIEQRCAMVIRAPGEQDSVAAGDIDLF
jgi:hypothetical protein